MNSAELTIEEQIRFYDNRWRDRSGETLSGIRLQRAAEILREVAALNLDAPEILDLGCGAGVFSGMVSAVGHVTAVDLSSQAQRQTANRFSSVHFVSGDLFDVELPKQRFDLIVLQEVIEHVTAQSQLISRCHSLLKSGGYLILTTPNARIAHLSNKISAAERNGQLQPIENLLTVSELRNLLKPHFRVLRCRTILPAGHTGMLRLINSPRLLKFRLWRLIRSALPVGLHTIAVGQAISFDA